ncbi:MAG: hypothetical protein CMF75_04700 [Maricaulis sp.]|nr:hypothetical protein [Maricaulis sp.]
MSDPWFKPRELKWAGLSTLVLLAGCTTPQGVQWGGVMAPQTPPENAVACETVAFDAINLVEPRMTNDIALTAYTVFGEDGFTVPMVFDVDASGQPVNIRYTGDEDLLLNAAIRDGVYRTAHALRRSHFTWADNAAPRYAVNCPHEETFQSDARWGATVSPL